MPQDASQSPWAKAKGKKVSDGWAKPWHSRTEQAKHEAKAHEATLRATLAMGVWVVR